MFFFFPSVVTNDGAAQTCCFAQSTDQTAAKTVRQRDTQRQIGTLKDKSRWMWRWSGEETRERWRGKDGAREELRVCADTKKKKKKFIGIPRRSHMQHSSVGAAWMTSCASTVPPAGSIRIWPGDKNLGHPYKKLSTTWNTTKTTSRRKKLSLDPFWQIWT